MIQLFLVAFSIGILGSFHCVGMCGPLALSLPLSSDSFFAKFSGAILYNAGRIVTYSAFGLLFGLIGQTAAIFDFQQWLSISVGVIIILFIVIPNKYKIQFTASSHTTVFFTSLRNKLGMLFSKKNHSSLFVIGLLNGLLPCGLVYMAVAGAIATGAVVDSVLFMAAFGLGTLPAVVGVGIMTSWLARLSKAKLFKQAVGIMFILFALLAAFPWLNPMRVEHIMTF